jgi:hypothetical protein
MEKHALPILGDLRVRELARAHVKALASALVAKLSEEVRGHHPRDAARLP